MKKVRRILAILGIVVLVALYICTLVSALFDSVATMGFFKASVAMTILVPVMLYAMIMFTRVLKPDVIVEEFEDEVDEFEEDDND